MQQVIVPFLGYIVLQLFTIGVGLCIVHDQGIFVYKLIKRWVFGQMLLFAVLQILSVAFILLRLDFKVLFWSYIVLCLGILLYSVFCLKKNREKTERKKLSWLSIVLLILSIAVILYQSGTYLFRMHLDEDDARWLAEANDALEYGDMMTRDPDTGDFIGTYHYAKDASSPWPMMYAVVSRLLNTRPAIFAHTIYAPLQLIMIYAIYWLIGTELFSKAEARTGFLLIVSVINLFFGRTVYTQSVFSLIRIWQGKATVAGIIIPLLLYLFICLNKRHEPGDWFKVLIVSCAGCLMSGMGIVLPAIMICVYGVYYILAYQKWRHIPLFLMSITPSIIFAIINYNLKG